VQAGVQGGVQGVSRERAAEGAWQDGWELEVCKGMRRECARSEQGMGRGMCIGRWMGAGGVQGNEQGVCKG